VYEEWAKTYNVSVDEPVRLYVVGVLDEFDEGVDEGMISELLVGACPTFESLEGTARASAVEALLLEASRVGRAAALGASAARPFGDDSRRSARNEAPDPDPGAVAESSGGEARAADMDDTAVAFLRGLAPPEIETETLVHVLNDLCAGQAHTAAEWLVSNDVQRLEQKRREAASRDEKRERERRTKLLHRYAESAEAPQKLCAWGVKPERGGTPPRSKKKPQTMRYVDGEAVYVREGERYITTAEKPEWNGGSTGRVFTKRKGGKGWV